MADSEVLKTLKDIPYRIQTASLKERRAVLKEIQDILSTPGITEPVVRFVCRVVVSTLHRYRDSTSQSYVKGLLAYLATNHRDWALRNLFPLLLDISEQLRNTATSKSICQSGLYALRWSTVLVEGALKTTEEDGVDYNSIVMSQANLLAVVTAFGENRNNEKAYSMLHWSWITIGKDKVSKWNEVLLSAQDAGPHVCVALSALCRHAKETGAEEALAKHKPKMLEYFTKSLISVKKRPNSNYIRGCSAFLQFLDRAEVHEGLLPVLQKAMLRSPETVIQAVGEVLANLQIDLDGPAVDIGKSLIGNLHSKDAWVRDEALVALRQLARRCSSATAARAHVAAAFAHYNGAAGKLTSSEDKQAVLNGVATLSQLNVSAADRLQLFDEVATQISRVLDSETHERTLCVALDTLQTWLLTLNTTLPDKILDIFKKNLSAKSTTQTVRIAYMSLVAAGVRAGGVTPAQREVLLPLLNAAVEKAVQQPLQQPVAWCGLAALLALAGLGAARALPAALLHDKVLQGAAPDVLIQVVMLCRTVLENYPVGTEEKNSPLCRAFILVLLSPIKAVRDAALEQAKLLLANRDKALLANYLVLKLNEVLAEGKIFISKEKSPPEEKADVTGKMILDCVQALCSSKVYSEEDAQKLAIGILPSVHHPLVAGVSRRAWRRVCVFLRLEPARLVALHAAALTATYVTGYTPNETMSNVVTTLVATNAEALAGSAIQVALDALLDPQLLRVTRLEYFTYLTPEGELYDKSSVPGNDDSKEMNLKRESKAYSYKDQLEELQLRRELEEKKRKQGKTSEAPLSAKQKEAIKAQLAKETIIRQRLSALNERVVVGVQLLEAVQRGSALAVCRRARRVVGGVLGALRSPLAAPRLLPAHLALRPALLPRHPALGATVARLTLRLHNPQCDLDPSWEEEDLDKATIRAINLVHSATAGIRASSEDEAQPSNNYFNAPGFCYVFPLLSQGLTREATREDEATMVNGLGVIAHHAGLQDDEDPLLRPELFPIDHMFQLLIDIISNSSGRVQTACTVALLETARCAARGGVCERDVSCLLAGLQVQLQVVRDAALRALLCVAECLPRMLEDPEYALLLTKRLLIATFDVSEDNKELAEELWNKLPLAQQWSREPELVELVLEDVQHPSEDIQKATALALAHLVEKDDDPAAADRVLQRLQHLYLEKLPMIPAKLDQFGHEVSAAVDEWTPRRGAGLALSALAPRLGLHAVPGAISFFVDHGLDDRNLVVRGKMLEAAMAIVDLHGKTNIRIGVADRKGQLTLCCHGAACLTMDLSAVLLFLGVVVAAVYYFLTRKLHYWEKKGVPGPKPLLIFGNIKDSVLRRSTINEIFEKLYNQFPKEKIVGVFRFWNPGLLVRDLDILQHVFIRDFDNFVDRGFNIPEVGVGNNLFFLESDKWRVLRSRLSPIFTTGKLKNMFYLLEERGDKFMEYLEPLLKKSPDQDAYPLVQKFTMSSIAACAFGIDIDLNVNDKVLTKIDKLIFYNHIANDVEFAFPGTLQKIKRDLFPAAVSDYFNNLVKRVVSERKGAPTNRKDFMDLLLELKCTGEVHGSKKHDDDKDRSVTITEQLMSAQAFVFYAAGYETTATTLGFMLHELARHQDIQDRLVQQVNEVLEANGGKLSYDCLKQMTILDQTLNETLRMYPIVDPLTRKSQSDYKVPGTDVTIAKGTMVFASARGIHYDEQYYPDPHKFDPERFTPENVKSRHPCAYMPFGLGPRNCIGMRFAHVQSRVCAVRLLTRYRVEPSPATKSTFSYDPTRPILGSARGIPLRLVPRT